MTSETTRRCSWRAGTTGIPRWPSPAFPGGFSGEQTHAHAYDSADGLEGKRVLVLGIGNSAADIATETSRVSAMTYLAMRRGAHIFPKYVAGIPVDELLALTRFTPLPVYRPILAAAFRIIQGPPQTYGLPTPDHRIGEAQPTVSSELLGRIGHGRIIVKPNIRALEDDHVRFTDDTTEPVDRIIYCTGYRISFPFISRELMDIEDNEVALYKNVVHPVHDGLYFIGLVQPLGPVMPIAEAQAEWIADVLTGATHLPSRAEMRRVIARDNGRMRRRYVRSDRHTIQIDFHPYLRAVRRERRRGAVAGPREHGVLRARPGLAAASSSGAAAR